MSLFMATGTKLVPPLYVTCNKASKLLLIFSTLGLD